jgi:peptidoglycan/xylan/chitin deacetylase (PgdA/CDA1 family)
MPGASGRRLMGHMQGNAPKDGTAIAAAHRALPFDPLMGVKAKFDPTKVTWIGNANDEVNICIVWHASPIKTFDDLKKHEMVVGSGGPASTDTIYPNIMNALFGTRFRVIHGYEAAAQTHIAMERGEVDGRCGMTWDALQATKPEWITEKKVSIPVQFALEKHPDLPNVPSVFDFARNEERQILALWSAPNKMGRPFYAPIELPKDRAEILRRSFDRTMKDPALLAEVEKTKLFVAPTTGEESRADRRIYATPADVVAARILDEVGVKATLFCNGRSAELYPEAVAHYVRAGHDVAGHGYLQDEVFATLTPEEERSRIRQTLDAIEKAGGRRPTGWITPIYGWSEHTMDIVVQEKLTWCSDALDANLPYQQKTESGSVVVIPWSDFVDNRALRASPQIYFDVYKETFDYLHACEPGSLINVGVHSHFGGRPLMSAMFRKVLRYLSSFPDVWFPQHAEVAQFMLDNKIDNPSYASRFFK